MSAPAHTPGPWLVVDDFTVENESCVAIARVNEPDDFPCRDEDQDEAFEAECKANAHLIAAAPDLLAQLRGLCAIAKIICSDLDIIPEETKVQVKANGRDIATFTLSTLLANSAAAIAKAEGRS